MALKKRWQAKVENRYYPGQHNNNNSNSKNKDEGKLNGQVTHIERIRVITNGSDSHHDETQAWKKNEEIRVRKK